MDSSITLLGFGLPLDDQSQDGSKQRFPNATEGLDDWSDPDSKHYTPEFTMSREMTMMKLMDEQTDQYAWAEKILAMKTDDFEKIVCCCCHLSPKMMEWCFKELQQKAQHFQETGITCAVDHGVFKMDVKHDSDLHTKCQPAFAELEKLARLHKDSLFSGTEPRTKFGLNVLNPSLFPLVFGRSKILPTGTVPLADCTRYCGKGTVIPAATFQSKTIDTWRHDWALKPGHIYSKKYQWLPSEVCFDSEGSPRLVSYINNVHPVHNVGVYAAIEELIKKAIPMWNYSLTALLKQSSVGRLGQRFQRKKLNKEESEAKSKFVNAQMPDFLESLLEDDAFMFDEDTTSELVPPEPGDFDVSKLPYYMKGTPEEPASSSGGKKAERVVNLQKDYKGLQVVVKAVNIILTPENPVYDGDMLHVEGILNEHFVASALYVYSNTNTIESRLQFDTRVEGYICPSSRAGPRGYEMYYDLVDGEPAIQAAGNVLMREGRLVTYHNGLYSRMNAVRLADSSKRGSRKYIMLYLVDPNVRIISTANVPPQRKDWWKEELLKDDSRLGQIPPETFDQIVSSVEDFPISLEDAKKIKNTMDAERKRIQSELNDSMFSMEVNFDEMVSDLSSDADLGEV